MSFCRSFALSVLLLAVLGAGSGCGKKDGHVEYAKAWTAYEAHDLAKAAQLFAKAAECDATNVDARVACARVRLELGDLDGSAQMLERALEMVGECTDIMLLKAQLAYYRKDYDAASSIYGGIAASEKADAQTKAQALSGLAVVNMTRSKFDLARVALLKALLLDRRNAAARYHLALVYRDGFGYPEAALDQFEIYVRLSQFADQRVQKVQRVVIPDLKELVAKKAMERLGSGKRDSSGCAALLLKAEKSRSAGKHKEARQLYENALKADPLSYPAALGLAVEWEKADTSAAGKKRALECYQNASSLKPCVIQPLLAVGRLASWSGKLAIAAEAYSRAVAAEPTNLEALDGLIRSLRKSGEKSVATASAYQKYREQAASSRKRK